MATYESISSAVDNNYSSGGLTITHPSGLTAGETMYAAVFAESGGGGTSSISISTPSGWTIEATEAKGTDDAVMTVFSKVADSGDVSAGSTNFGIGGSPVAASVGGHIVRLSSVGIEAGQVDEFSLGVTTTDTVTGFTPSREDCLFLAFIGQDSTINHTSLTSIAMATSNPTWTTRASTSIRDTSGSYFANLFTATATRPEDTATGDFTVTYANADSRESFVVIIAVSPQVNGSITPTTKLNAYTLSPIQGAVVNAAVDTPALNSFEQTTWTTIPKA